jgi:hypothetical protein
LLNKYDFAQLKYFKWIKGQMMKEADVYCNGKVYEASNIYTIPLAKTSGVIHGVLHGTHT